MAGQGGPDEETWSKMTVGEKRAYWISIAAILCIIVVLAAIRFFR